MKRLTFIEIDLDYCALRFGEGACNAAAGEKCFNTKATCKVRSRFVNEPVTLRFAIGTSYLSESSIDYTAACIEDISFMPATVSLGENLGTRASLDVTMSDFLYPDTGKGFDKYVQERSYDPFEKGTFWGKFRARHPYLRGRAIRLIRGELGQSLEQMETRHFVMESFQSASLDGRYRIVAKDALKMADGDRAKAPVVSRGFIVSGITASAMTAVIAPAGIGDLEYPQSGVVNIAGKEICYFTRSGDTLTLTRGQEGTLAIEHKAQDRVQVCIRYNGQDPADIIRDLFVNYAGVPAEYIRLDNWKAETGAFLRRLYTRIIAEPTAVDKLVSELIEQAALSVWWDDVSRTIRLAVLRKIETDAAVFDDSSILKGSLQITEQPQRRLSQVSTYFGITSPLSKASEPTSYHSMQFDVNLEAEDDYGGAAIKTIYSSWVPRFGRPIAQRVNEIMLGRFVDPPRQFRFSTFLDPDIQPPVLGRGYRLFARPLQNAAGDQEAVPIQITRLLPTDTGFDITADEMRFVEFSSEDLDNRTIIIDSNTLNFNWRVAYDQLYPAPTANDDIICIVSAGVIVGSQSVYQPAFDVGNWPSGCKLTLQVKGRIQGKGGNGAFINPDIQAETGGDALYTRYPVRLKDNHQIWSGGGGGLVQTAGGGFRYGGGGGQGYLAGSQMLSNLAASSEQPGMPSIGYPGGAAGQTGGGGNPFADCGKAINGHSFITFDGGQGDIRGPRVN